MKHVTVADKSILLGDSAADLLIEYSALVGQRRTADHLEMRAISSDGDEVLVHFLINEGFTLVVESTNSTATEPDNGPAESFLRDRLLSAARQDHPSPEELLGSNVWNALDDADD